MRKLLLPLVAAMLLCVVCEGPEGPMGPVGVQGEQGLPGEDGQDGEDGAGTRVWYFSGTPVPSMALWCLDVPQITLDDMPLISVYCAPIATPNVWAELPIFIEGMTGDGQFYFIMEGEICVENCANLWIRVVVVT